MYLYYLHYHQVTNASRLSCHQQRSDQQATESCLRRHDLPMHRDWVAINREATNREQRAVFGDMTYQCIATELPPTEKRKTGNRELSLGTWLTNASRLSCHQQRDHQQRGDQQGTESCLWRHDLPMHGDWVATNREATIREQRAVFEDMTYQCIGTELPPTERRWEGNREQPLETWRLKIVMISM